jgi:hypothetical protein
MDKGLSTHNVAVQAARQFGVGQAFNATAQRVRALGPFACIGHEHPLDG